MQKTENSILLTQNLHRLISLIILMAVFPPALRAGIPDKPAGYVTDLAGVLTASENAGISSILQQYEHASTNQIFILILNQDDADGRSIDDIGTTTANRWQVGQKDLDNGILITMIVDARKLRIDVGYGLEPLLTDAETMFIRENYMNPFFRAEKYAEGLKSGIEEIKKQLSDKNYMDEGLSIPVYYLNNPEAEYTDESGFTHDTYEDYREYLILEMVHGKAASRKKKVFDYRIHWWIAGMMILVLLGMVWIQLIIPGEKEAKNLEAGTFKHWAEEKKLAVWIFWIPLGLGGLFFGIEYLVHVLMGIGDLFTQKTLAFYMGTGFAAWFSFMILNAVRHGKRWEVKGRGRHGGYSGSWGGGGGGSFSGGGGSFGGGGSSGSW